MNISYLREFLSLAQTNSFSETACLMYSTQANISKHLKQLENELGVPLFERTSRKVLLSRYGEAFLSCARTIVNAENEYKEVLCRMAKDTCGEVTIGSVPVMAQYHVTDVIARFRREHPHFILRIVEAESHELMEMLRQNVCQLAFMRNEHPARKEFVHIPYYRDSLTAVLPADHPLANEISLKLEALRVEDFLLLQERTIVHDLCIEACQNAGFTPNIVYMGHRIENIIDLVCQKTGVALLMKKQAEFIRKQELAIVDIQPAVYSCLDLCYKKNTALSLAAKSFIRCTCPDAPDLAMPKA